MKFRSNTLLYVIGVLIVILSVCSCQNKSLSDSSGDQQTNFGKQNNAYEVDGVFFDPAPPKVASTLQFESMITSIFEDSKGVFWFGSHGDGICRYDPAETAKKGEKNFTYYTVKQGLPGLRIHEGEHRRVPMGNLVRNIKEDNQGNIWVQTAEGFCIFNSKGKDAGENYFKIKHPEEESSLITEYFDFSDGNKKEMWGKELDKLWFSNIEDNGVFVYDDQKLRRLTLPKIDNHVGGLNPHAGDFAVYSMYLDNDQNVWMGTPMLGIFCFNPTLPKGNKKGESFRYINEWGDKGIVRAIYQDKTDRVWISNVLVGVQYYENDSLKNFTEEQGKYSLNYVRNNTEADDSKMMDGIQTIEQDQKGDIWFGTFGDGLWQYDGNILSHLTEENGKIPNNTVKTIYKGKNGNLWFGIGRGSVYSFDGKSFNRFDAEI